MMHSRWKPASLRRLSALPLMLCAGGLASPALAGTRAGVDVDVSAKVSTNPFNAQNPGPAVVALSPSVAPWLTYESPKTTVNLRGGLLVDQYTRVYGRNTTASVNLDAQQIVSSTITMTAGAGYFESNNGLQDYLLAQSTGAAVPPGTPLPDVTTAGVRARTQSLSGRVGAAVKMSEADSVTLDLSALLTRSRAVNSSDYVNETANLGYSHQLSSRTTGTLSVQFTNVDYLKTEEGDGTIVSPQIGFTQQLNDRLKLEISGGASFANLTRAGGLKESFTAISGTLQLCSDIKRGTICLKGARAAQPTAFSGISTVSDVSLSFDRRIGRSNFLNVTGRFSRVDQTSLLNDFRQDYAGFLVKVSRKFNERLYVFATPSYSQVFDSLISHKANFELRAGLQYRFGAIQ